MIIFLRYITWFSYYSSIILDKRKHKSSVSRCNSFFLSEDQSWTCVRFWLNFVAKIAINSYPFFIFSCKRLNLEMLAYLWNMDQSELLDEMLANKIEAIIIKVAALGWCIQMNHILVLFQYLLKFHSTLLFLFSNQWYLFYVSVYDIRSEWTTFGKDPFTNEASFAKDG